MKRIHLFEFEDFAWFPSSLRDCMTRYLVSIHRLLGSSSHLADLLARALKHSSEKRILDICSGGTGPMLEVKKILEEKHGIENLELSFSDLYPNLKVAEAINNSADQQVNFITSPINATDIPADQKGVRSMVCSMHHMKPEIARGILKNAQESKQPICVFEISDNSQPIWLWWLAIPFSFLMTFFLTPMVRPMSWQQLVFTYLIPILPLVIAWDGAVSNARTYTLSDMDELLKGLESEDYIWEKGTIKGRANMLYLMGLPKLS